MRVYLVLFAAACGSATSNNGSPTGGGNVSFGGAQDIGDFKSILDNGGIPGPDTLDANGFFNQHYNAPPLPCDDTLCVTPGLSIGSDWLTGAPQAALQVSINTDVDPSMYQRLPLDIVAVIDRSGSMVEDGRLDKVKLGLHTMIANLQDGDRLAIVSFSDSARVDAPLATLDRDQLNATVDTLVADGGTDIFDGLDQGFSLLDDSGSDRQRRVILLSDGEANEGDSNTDDIIAMADSHVATGAGLTTVGVGSDFDLDLMRGLAEHGAGNFYFLEDAAAATEVFTEELDYFMTPLALNVQLTATAGTSYQFGEVVGTSLWTSQPGLGAMSIPAVFVASRTSAGTGDTGGRRGGGSAIFIQLVPTGQASSDGTVANLTLTYQLPGGGDPIVKTVSIAAPASTSDAPYLSAPEMAPRYAMYNMFLGLRAATNTTDLAEAAQLLQQTNANAHAWLQTHVDPDLEADTALVDEYLANIAAGGGSGTATSPGLGDGDPYYGPDACSAGGSPGWLALIGIAGLVATRRRR